MAALLAHTWSMCRPDAIPNDRRYASNAWYLRYERVRARVCAIAHARVCPCECVYAVCVWCARARVCVCVCVCVRGEGGCVRARASASVPVRVKIHVLVRGRAHEVAPVVEAECVRNVKVELQSAAVDRRIGLQAHRTNTHTHTHTHRHTRSHTRAHTRSHTHTQAHARARTRTPRFLGGLVFVFVCARTRISRCEAQEAASALSRLHLYRISSRPTSPGPTEAR
jgi:hypothetical protein